MLVTRVINSIEIDIDVSTASDMYFDESFALSLPDSGLSNILECIYKLNNQYIPLSAMIEITNRCNFNCEFCYIHTCERSPQDLTFDVIKDDLKYLIDEGLLHCVITGGECLANPDFSKIYTFLKNNGVLVTVLSNLSLLSDEHVSMFKALPPYKIDVSLYGYSNHEFQKNTNQRHFSADQIFKNVLKLRDAGVRVTCKTPKNSITQNEIPLLQEWCAASKIDYYYSSEIYENYDGKSMDIYIPDQHAADLERLHDLVDIDKSPQETEKYKVSFDCKGGQYGLFISYDYKLRPCLPFYCVAAANFKIAYKQMDKAINQMKLFIGKYSGKHLRYCVGCSAVNFCRECIISELKISEDQLHPYFIQQCSLNQSIFENFRDSREL